MKFITLSKKDILNLVKSLFKFEKEELIFIGLLTLTLFIISYTLVDIIGIGIERFSYYSSIFSSLIFVGALLLYKIITKSSEFKFYKMLFHINLFGAVIGYIASLYYLVEFSDYPVLFALAELLDSFSFIIIWIFLGIGLTHLFFHKLKAKELILFPIAIIIGIISSVNELYYNGFHIIKVFSIPAIISAITGILFYYSYKSVRKYIKVENPALFYFLTFGLIIFIIEYTNGLLLTPSSVPRAEYVDQFSLFLINF